MDGKIVMHAVQSNSIDSTTDVRGENLRELELWSSANVIILLILGWSSDLHFTPLYIQVFCEASQLAS